MRRVLVGLAGMMALLGGGAAWAHVASPPRGAVKGTFDKSCFGCGDQELIDNLHASNVWCAWDKDHVIVHISFRNRENAHVTVTVQPSYRIVNGGKHGSGLTSLKDVGIDAGAFRSWFGDAGKPKGVKAKTPISKCEPSLYSIKTG
jgi:hypothetical protein